MDEKGPQRPRELSRLVPAGAIGAVIIGASVATMLLRRDASTGTPNDARRDALVAYLREHLVGSDAALQVVRRVRRLREWPEDALFARLEDEFEQERHVLRSVLAGLGASQWSLKRVTGRVAGAPSSLGSAGHAGDLSLFRALEALAIGVQGKRCLWRALQSASDAVRAPGPRTFEELEAMAIRQWKAIDARRRALVQATFVGVDRADESAEPSADNKTVASLLPLRPAEDEG